MSADVVRLERHERLEGDWYERLNDAIEDERERREQEWRDER